MRIVLRALIAPIVLGVLSGAVMGGCAQKRATPAARTAPTPPPTAPVAQDEPPQSSEPQEKKPRMREAGVYVDGKQVGVMRINELPPALKSRTVNLGDGYTALRWTFLDYAASIGIDVKKIRAMHLYGGSRIAVVDAANLERLGDGLRFGFLQNERGKAKVIWPSVELRVGATVDILSGVAFYVEKEPPTYVKGELILPDGTKVDDNKMPYEAPDSNSGTRVYVDGTLVGAVKRKKLTNDLLVSKGDEVSRFSLMAYTAKLGVDAKHAKAVDLLAGDDVIAHMAQAEGASASFRVPQRNQGKILVDLPAGAAKVSAVQIYVKTKPPVRAVTKLEDAPAAAESGTRQMPDDDEN